MNQFAEFTGFAGVLFEPIMFAVFDAQIRDTFD